MGLGKWLPWRFIIKRTARAYGFLDPVTLLARLRRFGQPSEVNEPIELVRAGIVFHARGLVNTRAIQYNLDWIWPYWIVKQFKPEDVSFIPRGFSFSHINLTHRNWTAVGHPDLPFYPIVDPAGLVTPYLDGWSIDFWLLTPGGDRLIPSETDGIEQRLDLSDGSLSVVTRVASSGMRMDTRVWVERTADGPQTRIRARGRCDGGGHLVFSLRPYNPEGIQFIDRIDAAPGNRFTVNGRKDVMLSREPEAIVFSDYSAGDVAHVLDRRDRSQDSVRCDIGMATAAAMFPMGADGTADVEVSLPLIDGAGPAADARAIGQVPTAAAWEQALGSAAGLEIPDETYRFLYDAALRTLILLTATDAVPGPYTYKRFWFRDACLMVNALLGVGLTERARRVVSDFPARQALAGYFKSQEGEWDSNGQVLWIADRLRATTGNAYSADMLASLLKGADWIIHKRLPETGDHRHAGLLPAGFSAEHLGPNDFYYWDNFWALAGLQAAVRLAAAQGEPDRATGYRREADAYGRLIMASIDGLPAGRARGAIPASPYRRMDAGAIGSLVADYPLQLFPAGDPRIMRGVAYLKDHCFHSGAFFQDMIHSGINVYLTLAVAQTLLRAGDPGYRPLMAAVARLASPTGQWPEAIHPFTGGGCMGDGQHGWAAAEWLMMIRNLFVREEGNTVFLGSGVFPEWIDSGRDLCFGPAPVAGGRVHVRICKTAGGAELHLTGESPDTDLEWVAAIPGYRPRPITDPHRPVSLEPA